jgi:hypothetical protein
LRSRARSTQAADSCDPRSSARLPPAILLRGAMLRIGLLVILALAPFFDPLSSVGQQPAKVVRIGFLGPNSAASTAGRMEALRAGLRDLGYVEGTNLIIESRWADGNYERLPALARDLESPALHAQVGTSLERALLPPNSAPSG